MPSCWTRWIVVVWRRNRSNNRNKTVPEVRQIRGINIIIITVTAALDFVSVVVALLLWNKTLFYLHTYDMPLCNNIFVQLVSGPSSPGNPQPVPYRNISATGHHPTSNNDRVQRVPRPVLVKNNRSSSSFVLLQVKFCFSAIPIFGENCMTLSSTTDDDDHKPRDIR